MKENRKAVGLFSGGLDSLIAIDLIKQQGIEVFGFSCVSSFFGNAEKLRHSAEKNDFSLHVEDVSKPYIPVLKSPHYGFGKNLNPCIDCKIFMLQQALKYADEVKASFLFTGEVLGQRPMSQQKNALEIIQKKSGVENKLLRPLSAKLMPKTLPEEMGWVDRSQLLDIYGRGRSRQLAIAREKNLTYFDTPSGGCLLTESLYSQKLRDLFSFKKRIFLADVRLLSIGRYFRDGKTLLIAGRNKDDNTKLLLEQKRSDWIFQVQEHGSPIILVRGPKNTRILYTAAAITARYSKAKEGSSVVIAYGSNKENTMKISVPFEKEFSLVQQQISPL